MLVWLLLLLLRLPVLKGYILGKYSTGHGMPAQASGCFDTQRTRVWNAIYILAITMLEQIRTHPPLVLHEALLKLIKGKQHANECLQFSNPLESDKLVLSLTCRRCVIEITARYRSTLINKKWRVSSLSFRAISSSCQFDSSYSYQDFPSWRAISWVNIRVAMGCQPKQVDVWIHKEREYETRFIY